MGALIATIKYLTLWIFVTTFFTFVVGIMMLRETSEPQIIRNKKANSVSPGQGSTADDSPNRAKSQTIFGIELYKWWIVLFEISIVNQLFLCPYFWIELWPRFPTEEEGRELLRTPRRKLSLIMDHTVPAFLLIIEYSVNTIPLSSRHQSLLLAVYLNYIIVNFLYAMFGPKPIYPTIPWNNLESIVISAAIGLLVVLIF